MKEEVQNLIDGVIVSSFHESGPEIIENTSSLSLSEAFNLNIKLLTSLSPGIPEEFNVVSTFGSFPTDNKNLICVTSLLRLRGVSPDDERVETFGREIAIHLITRSKMLSKFVDYVELSIYNLLMQDKINSQIEFEQETFLTKLIEYLTKMK